MLCKFYGANLNRVFLREFVLSEKYVFCFGVVLFDRDYECFTSQNPEQVQIETIF